MEFLESLYEIENFGIYLFVVIGILVVLFLVVLFFGRKDSKKAKEKLAQITAEAQAAAPVEPIQQEPTPAVQTEVAFKEMSEPEKVEVEMKVEEPVSMSALEPNDAPVTTNVVLNSDFIEESVEPTPEEVEEPQGKDFDFDALADAISKELETIDKHEETSAPAPEVKTEEIFQTFKTEVPVTEPVVETPVSEPVVEQPKTRPAMPAVFSSVYVNREKEEIKPEPVVVPETAPQAPEKPVIDLPKMVDLPKKAEDTVQPVIEEPTENNIFSN